MSRTNTRPLRNVKHVGSIARMQSAIAAHLRDLGTSHHSTTPQRFSPQRTSNPAVAEEWEARVAALHAKVAIFRKSDSAPKRLSSKFDPAPVAAFDRTALSLALVYGTPAYEIVRHPDRSVTVWYHPEGQADQQSTCAHAGGANAAKVIPDLKREAFEAYSAIVHEF